MYLLNRTKAGLGEQGFSFVELMVAIVIMGIAVIPMFSLFDFGLRTQVHGEQELVALNLAQSKLEELLAEYYENDYKLLLPARTTSDTAIQGQIYQLTSSVAIPSGNVQELSVEVTFKTFGREKNVQLTTRVVEYR